MGTARDSRRLELDFRTMTTNRTLLGLALTGLILHSANAAASSAPPNASHSESTRSFAEDIAWHHDGFRSALGAAAAEDRDVLAYFWSDASTAAGEFYRNQMQDPRVGEAMKAFVCVSVQYETAEGRALFQTYKIHTMPTLLLVDPNDERVQDGIIGSTNVPSIVHYLKGMARDEDTLRDYERRRAQTPDDLDLRGELANRYASLGDPNMADELRAGIRRDDPKGSSEVAASMYLQDRVDELMRSTNELTPALVEELRTYVAGIAPANARRLGWDQVARLHQALDNRDGEMQARREAFPLVSDGKLYNWGWTNGRWWWSNRDVLTKKDRAFVLEVARKTAEVSERLSEEDPSYYDPGIFLTRRLHFLGQAFYMNGKKKDAIAQLERCVELLPSNGEFQARLAAYRSSATDGPLGAYSDYGASWSPNGRKLLFTSTRDGNPELYVADIKRDKLKKLQRVTRSPGVDDQGSFCAKGKEVVFRSGRFKTAGIYRAQMNGEECRLLVSFGDDPAAPLTAGAPEYREGDEQLALIRMDAGVPHAMVAGADGGGARRLMSASDSEDSIAWAGDKLVVAANRDGQKDLFLIDSDGSGERNLTPAEDGTWVADVSASSDGSRILFAGWRDGRSHIFAVDADGENLSQLTIAEFQDRRPRFSPNSKRIVFDRTVADGTSRLWSMSADGGDVRALEID